MNYIKIMKLFVLVAIGLFSISSKHIGPKYCTITYDNIDKFGAKISGKYPITYMETTAGCNNDCCNDVIWFLHFVCEKPYTFEQGNELAYNIFQELLNSKTNDPIFKAYIKASTFKSRGLEVKPDYFGFKIAFWDENVDRPKFPYLSLIRVFGTKMEFYYANPITQALEKPIVKQYRYSNGSLVFSENI